MKQFTLLLAILTMFSWQSYSQTSTCDYTFDMTDSFGDGWNGATVDFVQNGLIVASQTLASGSSGTATVALDDNVTTYLIGSSAGSYSGETGFTFNDPSGVAVATLASGVGYVSGDTLATFTTVCPAPPACLDPTALSAANITDVSADLSWTDAAASGSSNVEYGTAGFALGMGTQILGTGNTTESIGSLLPATAYEFYVQSDCGADQSTWVGPIAFTTNVCDAASTCDYTFNMVDDYGDGWNGNEISFVQNGVVVSTHTIATGSSNTATITLCDGVATDVVYATVGTYAAEMSFDVVNPFGVTVASYAVGSVSGSAGTVLTTITTTCTAPACADPSGLTATITGSSADLSWTDNAASGLSNVEYGVAGFTLGTGTAITGTTNTTETISGLTAGTSYEFYVQSDCGGAQSTWVGPIAFNIPLCDAASQCDFTFNMTDSYGDGWGTTTMAFVQNGVTVSTQTLPSLAAGSATIALCENITTYVIATSADFYMDENGFTLTDSYGVNVASLASGTVFAAGDTLATFTSSCAAPTACAAVDQCDFTFNMADSYGDGWNGYSFSFVQNGITLSTETIASGGSGTATIALCDNVAVDVVIETAGSYAGEISFDVIDPFGANVATLSPGSLAGAAGTVVATFTAVCTAPACPDPLGLTASNVTANSADISWIDQALSGVSNVEYGTAGFVLGTGTAITGTTDTTANLAGLTTATTYEFYVQSDCGTDQSSWSGPFAFTTSFNAPDGVVCSGGSAAFIFTDDLEANTGWTGDIGSGAGQWDFPTAFPGGNSTGTGPSGPASGTTFAEYEASGSQAVASMVTPMIDLGAASSEAELSFNMHAYGSEIGTLNVGVGNSPTGPFTNEFSWTGQYQTSEFDPWANIGVDLTAYLGQQIYIEFSYGATGPGYSGDLAIDLVQVEACVSCVPASALTASNITASSADLGWTDGGFGVVNVEYGVAGYTFGTGTQVVATTNNPESVSGLLANTTYEYYVQSNCGDFLSGWVGPMSFTTDCDIYALPWSEGMDNAGALPDCWSMAGTENWQFSNTTGFNNIGQAGALSGNTDTDGYFAWVDASGGVAGDSATLTSPMIDISSLTVPQLSFYEISNNQDGTSSELGVEVWNGATWDSVATYNTNTAGWEEKIIDLSGISFTGPAQVRFTFSEIDPTAFNDDIAIDDVSFEETPTCLEPISLMASNVTISDADLSWTDAAASGLSNVEYGVAGFTLGTGTAITGTANTTESISGLASGTTYEFYVQSDCGTSQSLWSGPYAFTTNLCGSADQCDYTFEMIDSYGDGWNGNSFSFVQGGNVVSTQTLASGSSGTATIALCTDFAAYVIVDAIGSYTTEVSFNVIDPFGVNVGSLSAGSLSGSVAGDTLATFTANCTAPLCDAATGLTASNITSSSADVSWDNAGSGSYNLEFQTAGFTQGTGFVVPLTDTTLSIPGLTASTSYDYYIQVNCGSALSTWVGPYTFTTGFNAPDGVVCASGNATFVFSDDLETNTGWTGDIGPGAGQWDFPTAFPGGNSSNTGPSGPASGTTFAEYEASGSQDTASMVTPMIDLGTASSEAELSFNMHAYGVEIGTLNVGVGNSPTGPFTNEFSWTGQYQTAATDPWANIGVDLTAYLGQQIYIEFSYAATGPGWEGDLAIDLVQVEACVSCLAPSTLAAANITDVSADLSWTDVAASGSSNVEYGVAGFTLGTGTAITGTANTTESISGLSAATAYEFYVQSDCGTDQSAWVGPISFTTTLCPLVDQCDYTFNMTDSYGDGWNGYSFSFVQNGITLSTETIASGGSGTATIALCDNVAVDVVIETVGSFATEISFDVIDPYGANVATLSPGSLAGVAGTVVATFTASCAPPACLDPAALTASNVGVSTADLSWTDVAASGLSNVEYGVAGFTLGTGTAITGTTNTTESISGLMPVTTYEFYVQSDCGTAQSTWVGPISFTTLLCPATSACDYTFNMTDSFGDGWNGNEISFVQNGVTVYTGTIASGATNTATIALCDGVATDVVYAATGSYASEVSFNVVDPFGVTVATLSQGSLSGTSGTVLATFTTNCTAPACADPTALTASNMTDVSADLSWTDAAASGLSNVEYGVAGFTLGTGTAITGTTNTTESISGLSGNTTYEFYVQSDCGGDQSAWVGPIAFTTPCSALALPWSEGMDNAGALPGCWSMAGSENWQFSNTAGFNHIGNNGVITGNTDTDGYFAWVDASGGAVGDSATLTSPMIDISSLTVPQLSFYELSDNEGGINSELGVEVWDGATWNSVATYNTNTAGWEEKIIDLSGISFTGPAQVRFTFSEIDYLAYVDDIAIDDVSFEETPTCLEPIALTASNITDVSADVSWTDAAASGLSNVEYGVAGFTLGTGTAITGTANTTESISGLTAATAYEFYVQSDCGTDQSVWAGPFTFTTALCDAASTCDYTLNMADSWGDGWNGNEISFVQNGVTVSTHTIASGATNTATIALCDGVATDVVYATVGSYAGEMSFDVIDPFGNTVATVSEGSVLGAAGTVLATFTTACTIPACLDPTALTASNMTDVSADVSWTDAAASGLSNVEYGVAGFTLGTGTAITGTTNTTESISGLTAATAYEFYVQSDCGTAQSAWVGPFTFTTAVCDAASTCDYTFNMVDDYGDGWNGNEISFVQNGVTVSTHTIATGASNTATIALCDGVATDVVYATVGTYAGEMSFDVVDPYGVIVATAAVGSVSGAAGDVLATFTTSCAPPACADPTALTASNMTDVSADLGWTDNAASGLSNVEYGVAGFTLGTGTQVLGTANNPESISGLTAVTAYEFYVQSDCGTAQSAWVGPFAFTTAAPPCLLDEVTVTLYDTYGDGGGEITVDGNVLTNSGSSNSMVLCLDLSTTCFDVLYASTDSWSYENSWDVVDATGTVIGSGADASGEIGYCPPPACTDPTALTASNMTDVSADVSWTDAAASGLSNVEYGVAGFTLGTGTAITGTTNTTESISGLTAATAYEFYVQSDCGTAQSAWVGPFAFTTAVCDAASTCDYTFNMVDDYGDGWNGNEISFVQNGVVVSTHTIATGSSNTATIALCDGVATEVVYAVTGSYASEMSFDVVDPFGVTVATAAVGSVSGAAGDVLATFTTSCTPPACMDPTALSAANITGVSADLSWTDAAASGSSNVEYGIAGFTLGMGTQILGTGNTTESIGSLLPATAYEFYVQSDCGTTQSAWVGPFAFNTPICDAANQCDYTFTMTDMFDDGWDGASMLFVQSGISVSTQALVAGASGLPVSIALCDNMTTYVIAEQNGAYPDEIGFTLDDPNGASVGALAQGTGFLTGDTLATFVTSCAPPVCTDPTALSASNITTDAADISWTSTSGLSNVEYGVAGFAVGTGAGTSITGTANTTESLSGLLATTAYEFYVQSDCGVNQGAWVGPFAFTTATPPCLDASALSASNITTDAADISWTNASGLSNVEYGVAGFALGGGTSITGTSNTTESLSGLLDDTAYEFYVQSDCGVNQSAWVGPFAFTTDALVPTTQLEATDCGSTVSGLTALVKADAIPGTSNYRFRVINGTDTVLVDRAFRSLPLGLVPVAYATTYSIDVAVTPTGGVQGDYGSVCTVTTPIPTTQLGGVYCGMTTTSLTRQIKASEVVGASNYKFRFIEGVDTLIIDRPFRSLNLGDLALAFDKTYEVDVAITYNGVEGSFGPVCQFITLFPTTSLGSTFCNSTTLNLTKVIKAQGVSGATGYRFRFIEGADTAIVDRPFRALPLNTAGLNLVFGKTYNVDVAVTVGAVTGGYGPVCQLTTEFPTAQLGPAYCGMTTFSLTRQIKSTAVSGATNYKFRFIDTAVGGDTLTIDRPFRAMNLNQGGFALEHDKTYSVQIAVTLSGVEGDFGPACLFTTVFPDTQLAPLYCNSTANNMNNKVFALEAPGATNYRFRFTNGTDVYTIDRPFRNCQLSLVTGLNTGTTYDVDIQVTAAGVTGVYGPVCTVTTPGAPAIGTNSNQKDLGQDEGIVFETTLSPNPFSDATTLHISSEDASSVVSVSVYDATGRLIESRLVDLRQETDVRIGTDYNPGFYQVIIVQGDNKKTARIVKQ